MDFGYGLRDSRSVIDEHFRTAKDYVRTLLRADTVHALVIEGEAGLGKSFTTVQTLKEAGLKAEDFVVINSHSTPLELYHLLYNNRNEIVILDDIGSLWDDKISIGIILAALWNPTGKRMVSYFSSTSKLNAPQQFEFGGKIIILTNRLPQELETIRSRCFCLTLKFSFAEKLRLIRAMCDINKMPFEIVEFIEQSARPVHKLNFRLLFKIYEIYRHNINNGWQRLAMEQFEVKDAVL